MKLPGNVARAMGYRGSKPLVAILVEDTPPRLFDGMIYSTAEPSLCAGIWRLAKQQHDFAAQPDVLIVIDQEDNRFMIPDRKAAMKVLKMQYEEDEMPAGLAAALRDAIQTLTVQPCWACQAAGWLFDPVANEFVMCRDCLGEGHLTLSSKAQRLELLDGFVIEDGGCLFLGRKARQTDQLVLNAAEVLDLYLLLNGYTRAVPETVVCALMDGSAEIKFSDQFVHIGSDMAEIGKWFKSVGLTPKEVL